MNANIFSAQSIICCDNFPPAFDFFTCKLGFRVKSIFPADNPQTADLIGYGLQLRLVLNSSRDKSVINLVCKEPWVFGGKEIGNSVFELEAPNGTIFTMTPADDVLILPALKEEYIVSHLTHEDSTLWTIGRAGLRYRDLVPGRLGGRYIASHIHIPVGGPVADYVHFHKVKFQMIFCFKGWVKVVYEDQGEPFVLQEGDCVTQPPQIRHRVLEASDDLQVIEVGCPAVHLTIADFDISLPNVDMNSGRVWENQKFVRFQSSLCPLQSLESVSEREPSDEDHMSVENTRVSRVRTKPSVVCGLSQWSYKETGIWEGTGGVASCVVLRATASSPLDTDTRVSCPWKHDADFLLLFVLAGSVTLRLFDNEEDEHGRIESLVEGSSVCIPSTMGFCFHDWIVQTEVLEISVL